MASRRSSVTIESGGVHATGIERFSVQRTSVGMDASDLLPHRTALIGAAVALAIGVTGGLALKTGSQTAPETEMALRDRGLYAQAQPIAWPSGKVPDYVGRHRFPPRPATRPAAGGRGVLRGPGIRPGRPGPSPRPRLNPCGWSQTAERTWPSTGGDILNTRLPEDSPPAPEPSQAIDAPDAPVAPEPVTLAAAPTKPGLGPPCSRPPRPRAPCSISRHRRGSRWWTQSTTANGPTSGASWKPWPAASCCSCCPTPSSVPCWTRCRPVARTSPSCA